MSSSKGLINKQNIEKSYSIDSDKQQGKGNFLNVLDESSSEEEDEEPSEPKIYSNTSKENVSVINNSSSASRNKSSSSEVNTIISKKNTTPAVKSSSSNVTKVNTSIIQNNSNDSKINTNSSNKNTKDLSTNNSTSASKENTITPNEDKNHSNDSSSVPTTPLPPPPAPPLSSSATSRRRIGESEDDVDETVLALIWSKGKLGAASYNMSTSVLSVMDDIVEDTFNFNITKALYMQIQPRHVVTTSGTPDDFQSILKKLIIKDSFNNQKEQSTSSSSSTPSSIDQVSQVSLNILNKNQNDFEYCYHRVKLLKLSSEPDDTTNAERITFLNSVLNFDSSLMIHGLGLLLKYLDENWSKLTLNPSEQIEYLYINSIMLNDLVMMDEDTFNVLNIMQSKFHPSLFKYGSCSIEVGMNLFTFLNRCQSRPGVQHLWRLMRHPTRDINIINERHKIIEFFMNPNNENFYKNLKSSLKQISRLTPAVLKRYKTPQAKPADWKKFSKTISHLTIIGEICNRCKDVSKIFETVANSINDDIHRVRYFIDYIVDHDMSKQQGRFIVMDGVDPQLDELNYRKQCLPKLLTEAAEKELKNLPNIINGFRYVYLPGIGYLVVITEWNNHAPPEEPEEIPGLEFVFSSNGTRHYKSNGARELDESTGDIVRMITCREKQIMLRLIEFVSKYIGTILKAIENCAELDAVLSLADVSRDQNYVKPEIVMQHIIDIKEGRDPLYELFGNYVANDIISGDNSSCIKIFSGPNACGKTIYMKQIALIVYLTHIGCFLPVKSATIGIVTHILTQMSSVQSISEDASAYLIDLRQINNIIYSSTPNSLILMDEFGRGTSEIDSLAILTSILKGFIDRGNSCPHVLCATHIHRVAELLPLSPIIKLQTFEFIVDSKKQVTFLYRLISGKSGKSFAHTVARSTGLSDTIVDRAEKLFEYMKKGGLPKCNPDEDRRNILKYIAEIKLHQRNIHVDELRQWFQQAFYRKLPPRFN
ncbi:hypothetical protein HCN44_002102 [Aphidius gifuensis]|uniref:DNA mismatch repair protein n=1 Tax=Aphidius gifuensis TaxID=684658 RepID=A0A835CXE1_APHGI|nr:hypothetical protein HCN44_002102 [Aphidius gifuensis]